MVWLACGVVCCCGLLVFWGVCVVWFSVGFVGVDCRLVVGLMVVQFRGWGLGGCSVALVSCAFILLFICVWFITLGLGFAWGVLVCWYNVAVVGVCSLGVWFWWWF